MLRLALGSLCAADSELKASRNKSIEKEKPMAKYADMNSSESSKAAGAGRATFRRSDNLITSADMQ
jgi:hypothetical protein